MSWRSEYRDNHRSKRRTRLKPMHKGNGYPAAKTRWGKAIQILVDAGLDYSSAVLLLGNKREPSREVAVPQRTRNGHQVMGGYVWEQRQLLRFPRHKGSLTPDEKRELTGLAVTVAAKIRSDEKQKRIAQHEEQQARSLRRC